jgi:hypothetical protein
MAVVGTLIVTGVWHSTVRRRHRTDLFGRLAPRWEGRVEQGGFFEEPRVLLQVDGVRGELDFHDGRNPWTRVRFQSPSERRLRITPQRVTTWLRSIFGGAEIEVGDRAFDASCHIEATDARWARDVLTRQIRQEFLRVHGITLDVGPGGVTLKVQQVLVDDGPILAQFVEVAILILREVRKFRPTAGVVLAEVITGSGACPVCGHPVDKPKPCPRCGTPHHEDCWTYMGGCAIFGCDRQQRKAA